MKHFKLTARPIVCQSRPYCLGPQFAFAEKFGSGFGVGLSFITNGLVMVLDRFSDLDFSFILFIAAFLLYANTITSGYVWDDRAAVVDNKDVHGSGPLSDLFANDFWGQDMKLIDSHKSWRPVTVLSFRVTHALVGLHPSGYHLGNVLIYCCCVVIMFWSVGQWMSRIGARVASLLFCFHPIHVEAVASIVGRADSLCGLFFLAACYTYTFHLRLAEGSTWRVYAMKVVSFMIALFLAIFASLTKEIGATIFGLFILLEFAHAARSLQLKSLRFLLGSGNSQPLHLSASDCQSSLRGALYAVLTGALSLSRMSLVLSTFVFFMAVRLQINGKHALYKWSPLENHIHILPTFAERAFSYAQYHFWYMVKLVFPRYLCFDYGLSCIPVVRSWRDPRNLFPLTAYTALGGLTRHALLRMRVPLLIGLAFLLVPLIPALHLFFPVGTLLAERLLFLPSVGACVVAGELISVDGATLWLRLAHLWSARKTVAHNFPSPVPHRRPVSPVAVLCVLGLGPLLCLFAIRVITRNQIWQDEGAVFESALSVCPQSTKALNNVGMYRMWRGDHLGSQTVLQQTLSVFNNQASAHINLALSLGRLGHFLPAACHLQRARLLAPAQPKPYGYEGMHVGRWVTDIQQRDSWKDTTPAHGISRAAVIQALKADARRQLENALALGWDAPSILFGHGSLALERGELPIAIVSFEAAIAGTEQALSNPHVPSQDLAPLASAYGMLALAHARAGHTAEAEQAYLSSLELEHSNCETLNNYSLLLKATERYAAAREALRLCVKAVEGSGISQQQAAATYNNLGLLEELEHNFEEAVDFFEKALQHMPLRQADPNWALVNSNRLGALQKRGLRD